MPPLQGTRAACEFLLEKPEFKGSGKSVVMSFLIDELCRRKSHQLPQPMILYHYCQNDETGHALYIFSSLILSLLQQCVGLKKAFFDWYKQDLLIGNFEPSTNVHKLVGFFQRTVEELDRPLYLVLDGLDECDTGSRNILLDSLRDVTTVAEVAELADDQGVMALIQPFVASIDFDDLKKRQIIIVHQSAKEFILNELAFSRPGLQSVEKLAAAGGNAAPSPIPSRLENKIFNICVRYLLLDEINHVPLFSDEQIAIQELPQDLDLFSDGNDAAAYTADCSWENWEEGMIRYDPADRGFGELFVYASCHWINHFRLVVAEPLPDLRSIEKLCQANSIRLHNWTSQNSRPDCVAQARFEFDGSLYDPLSITSLYGSEELLLKMLETSEFESREFLPNTALLAVGQVLQWGDLCRLRMLFFGRGTRRHLQNLDFFRHIIDSWHFSYKNYRQDWDAAFDIINDIPDILVRQGWGNELLCLAASQGCLPVIDRLMKMAQHNIDLKKELLREHQRQPRSLAHRVHQSIGEAVLAGHVGVVEYLLQQEGIETHLYHRNADGENVLHLASMQCNPAIFRALAPRFPDGISQKDCQGKTALMRVVESLSTLQNRIESVQTLLSLSATHQSALSTKDQQEALRIAERMCNGEMCNLLIEPSQVSLNE
ncbi:hypothetical protein CEP54_010212 [Fusarium duplospermum]|uniref:Nephrocystin 3-like N-terminal domain-containing protein n=1 Tax=Fusarium duplospermum TaxID=1325734 RepID=A0A428PL94_9HYPO|nr:hypothetical protein CEP54_010212 [Fusarium duplospermum]